MLHVHIVLDGDGVVQSVNSTVEGAAVFAFGWGEGAIGGDGEWTIETVTEHLEREPSVTIEYQDGTTLSVQRHGVFA